MILPKLTAHQSFKTPLHNYQREPLPDPNLFHGIVPAGEITPQVCGCGGGIHTCQYGNPTGYLYAMGTLVPYFPSLSVETEFNQAATEDQATGSQEQQMFKVLSNTENRYLAREILWTLQIAGVDLLILKPDSEDTLTELISGLDPSKPQPSYNVFLGKFVPMLEAMPMNDETLPMVVCFQYSSIAQSDLIANIQKTITSNTPSTNDVVQFLLNPMMELAQNPGNNDALRALNYAIITYMGIYSTTWQMHQGTSPGPKDSSGFSLENVETLPSKLQGNRLIFDIIFTYGGNSTNIASKWFCRIDVTGPFPSLVSEMQPYYGSPGMLIPNMSPLVPQGSISPSFNMPIQNQTSNTVSQDKVIPQRAVMEEKTPVSDDIKTLDEEEIQAQKDGLPANNHDPLDEEKLKGQAEAITQENLSTVEAQEASEGVPNTTAEE